MNGIVLEGRCVPPDHPSLPGHFPGRPIVPGVVLLDEVVAAINEWQGKIFVPAAFPSVKFVQPLLPGELFAIRLKREGERVEFECTAAGRVLIRGVMVGSDQVGGGRP